MEKVLYNLCNNLYSIRLLFSGMYDFEVEKERKLKIDPRIKNIELSYLGDDKNNLKSDRVKVLKDYAKSFNEKKEKKEKQELAEN